MFNDSQIEAIHHTGGPALVLAGPGSGKTKVIIHRVKELIEQENVNPANILVVTFTKVAADEMQRRFVALMNENSSCPQSETDHSYSVMFGTFHSVFYKILKYVYNYRENTILTERQKNDILKEIIIRLRIEVRDFPDFLKQISNEISHVKGNGIKLEDLRTHICDNAEFIHIFNEYELARKTEGKIDFDDILLITNRLLKDEKDMLSMWQEKFKYILVDEFQDINAVQYENIRLLSGYADNLFIVGDDDQSIYGFRGARPEMMFQFKEDYPSATEIFLNINYRSTKQIVEVAEKLIKNNIKRYKKKSVSNNGKGSDVDIRQFKNQQDEIEYLINLIEKYLAKGIDSEKIAILVRNNSQAITIRNKLLERRIGSNVSSNMTYAFNHPIAKDIISYMKAAIGDINMPLNQNENLMNVINKPARYISRQVIHYEKCNLAGLEKIYSNNVQIQSNIKELKFHLEMIKTLAPYPAINYIRYGAGYDTYMREQATEKQIKYIEVAQIYDKILMDASRYNSVEEWIKYVEEAADERKNKTNQTDRGQIQITTMHASKGLEYDVVFIVDVNQGIIPGKRAVRDDEIEEERRVFYVAVTRAAKKLHIFSTRYQLGNTVEVSQFVNEIAVCK